MNNQNIPYRVIRANQQLQALNKNMKKYSPKDFIVLVNYYQGVIKQLDPMQNFTVLDYGTQYPDIFFECKVCGRIIPGGCSCNTHVYCDSCKIEELIPQNIFLEL